VSLNCAPELEVKEHPLEQKTMAIQSEHSKASKENRLKTTSAADVSKPMRGCVLLTDCCSDS